MTTALDHARPVAVPGRVGQATAVEQSRAIAEVQAQVIVAQQNPRNVDRAVREVERSCAQRSLAEKAFYRYRRGGSQISGESITLAKELARCWGNINWGLAEMRRDDDHGESEMMAFAWDLETNARQSTTFIVPHVRDTTSGRSRLVDVRDIYENNANMGSRRMREMILSVLPAWLVEDAKAACYATLENGDGTVAERAAQAVEAFGRMGVRAEQLVQKVGAPQGKWTAADLAQLMVIYRSVERGETTREDEFGVAGPSVTAADVLAESGPQKPDARRRRGRQAEAPPPDDAPFPGDAQAAQPAPGYPVRDGILAQFTRLGVITHDGRADHATQLLGVAVPSLEALDAGQAERLLGLLARCETRAQLDALLADGEVPGAE